MHQLFILTGVHGSGKTTAAEILASRLQDDRLAIYFPDEEPPQEGEELIDSIGGTDDQAQRRKIVEWVRRVKHEDLQFRSVLLVMMCWPEHFREASLRADHRGGKTILFDCTDTVRRKRLTGPRQAPGLDDVSTYNKAAHLYRECTRTGAEIVDTSQLGIEECADLLEKLVLEQAEPVAKRRTADSAYALEHTASTEETSQLATTSEKHSSTEEKKTQNGSPADAVGGFYADPRRSY